MRLKNLTLSGFKSFGRTTVFEFPTTITAIVGPNGSGKSNVAEALRWALGEQSMKSLRGKKGEDLIFNGSEKAPRLGRAEVKLVFDNSDKRIPLEFEDVVVARRVHRDGANEYLLNSSQVRLKDIFELLSKVGLGSTQHHIISQGEVDRILWASPVERQSMIEEALGLREFYMKARETERKLAETEQNVKQVEAQRREIQPHLKYLRMQAEKMKAHEGHMIELEAKVKEYAVKEYKVLAALRARYAGDKDPLVKERKEKEEEIDALQRKMKEEEREFTHVPARTDVGSSIEKLEEKRRALDRELGKLEGLLQSGAGPSAAAVPQAVIMKEVHETVALVDELMQKDGFEALKSGLKDVKVRLESIIKLAVGGDAKGALQPLQEKKRALADELRALEKTLTDLKAQKAEDDAARQDLMSDLRGQERALRELEREQEGIREKIREIEFAEEQYKARNDEFEKFIHDMRVAEAELAGDEIFADDHERITLMRAIERLRLKLEEAGGIDPSVHKEYDDTLARDEFLMKELDDLKRAEKSLHDLLRELDVTLKEQFSEGIKNINKEFLDIFQTVFGGGKASLVYEKPKKKSEDGVEGAEGEEKGGVHITLDIPRKRLRSLDMLSGGERALTSVALLFAMTVVNPPPFLVLDETDAALDEANSQRYGDMLEKLAKRTQLVVITHNRETMRRAGVLYGVTQGDDAISRVLSIKFEEANAFAKA